MVKSCRNGINSCSSSNELGARYAQPHRKPSKERKTTPGKHVPAFAVQMSLQKLRKWKRNSFCSSEQSHFGEGAGSEGSQGTTGPAGLHKMVRNRKAPCFALLRRITNLKVSILMSSSSTVTRKGVASSGSMVPCRSHHGYYTRQNWIF